MRCTTRQSKGQGKPKSPYAQNHVSAEMQLWLLHQEGEEPIVGKKAYFYHLVLRMIRVCFMIKART
jgi:hypothetical protein